MRYRALLVLAILGLSSSLFSADKVEYPRISLVGPGAGKTPVDRDKFIALVVEGPFLSCDKTPLPADGEVDYVNQLLKTKGISYLGVYTRAGVKYGDVVRAIDILRKTDAKDIGVNLIELPAGREP